MLAMLFIEDGWLELLDYKILINDFINKKNNMKIDNLYYIHFFL